MNKPHSTCTTHKISFISSVSGGSNATWLSLLEEMKNTAETLIKQRCRVPKDTNSGLSFRSALEDLCKQRGEKKIPRLEAKLFPSYARITELATAVGHSAPDLQNLLPSDGLEGLI